MPDFETSRLAGLKPALAGLVIDNRLDYKELYATIIDLVVRGYIYYDEQHGTFAVVKTEGLAPYEIDLLSEIFEFADAPTELEFDFLRYGYKDISLSHLMRYIGMYMSTPKGKPLLEDTTLQDRAEGASRVIHKIIDYAVEQGLYTRESGEAITREFEEQGKRRGFSKLDINVLWLCMMFSSGIAVGACVAVVFGPLKIPLRPPSPLEMVVYFVVFLAAGLIGALLPPYALLTLKRRGDRRAENGIFKTSQTATGSELAKKYRDLYDFLAKHPLKGGRLANEFLPFSIAFGIDRSFEKKFQFGKKDWDMLQQNTGVNK